MRVTLDQISAVLQAVAEIEGWDGAHETIRNEPDGAWTTTKHGLPFPTPELQDRVRRIAEQVKTRKQS